MSTNVMSTSGSAATMLGRTKAEWIEHIEMLFSIARDGEAIPQAVLLYGWQGTLRPEEIDWANRLLAASPGDKPEEQSHV